MAEQGYLQAGDVVGDPFGGVALGALDCMRLGCHWRGMELEQKFVDLGQQNIDLWMTRYKPLWPDTWGSALLLQGDSRQFAAGMGQVAAVVSSPPYINSINQFDQANDAEARIRRKAAAGVDVSQAVNVGGPNSVLNKPQMYGQTEGQLGAMQAGELDAVVSSPPFEASLQSGETASEMRARWGGANLGGDWGQSYGDSPGNMGNDTGNTFWTAARVIVDQCYQVLKPGGVAVWVLKRFVRNKQIVEFPDQWRQMCEAAGFETVEWIRAWLVEDRGTQIDLFGNHHTKTVERKSFFRRLYERKYPGNSIDWEDVIVMRKV